MSTPLRVLNLEDSLLDARLIETAITARWPHCEIVRMDTRADFIAALEQKNFELILSDYSLPGFGGLEALAIAREKCPEIPFIFVSATIGEDTAIETLKNGAIDYVLKHRLARLIPAMERALHEAAEHAESERAEKAMRESEHKYREVFEHLGEAAFLADAASGKIIDTNRCAEKMLGCARSDILGRKQTQFLAASDQATLPDGASFECAMTCANNEMEPG
jgi:DNA-binding NtrC family response regulator